MNSIKPFFVSRHVLAIALCALLLVISAAPVFGQTVLQGYDSDEKLQRGMIVSLRADDGTKLEPASIDTVDTAKGVVVDPNDSPVRVTGNENQYFVAAAGHYEVLVSNENGSIKSGDYIGVSSFAGIGMKVAESQEIIVGRAVASFGDGSGNLVSRTQTKDGRAIAIGRIQLDVGVAPNPVMKVPDNDRIPDALQKITDDIADKPVGTVRIYVAFLILLITAFVAGTTLFSGVRSTFISVSRNPLSKNVIYKGLLQVLLLSLIIFITGIFGVYLLIRF